MSNVIAEMAADRECPFKDICEEFYTTEDMIEHRKNCNCENCHYCDHYWGFFQGYCDATEL